ncbi:MAG: hypothetical protein AAB830_02360 [Patescibacteria group bacterium]
MKKTVITILSITVFIGGLLIFYQNRLAGQKIPAVSKVNQQTSTEKNSELKTGDQSAITVIVTPIDISPQLKEWKFDIVMDTHSVELDQDLTKSTVLLDDQGREYKPITWEGAGPGGHHREGVLIFNAVQPMPKSVEIKIKDIGGIPERSFKWDLK